MVGLRSSGSCCGGGGGGLGFIVVGFVSEVHGNDDMNGTSVLGVCVSVCICGTC